MGNKLLKFNQGTRHTFKTFSNVVGVGSYENYIGFNGAVSVANSIDDMLDFLCRSRDNAFDVHETLQ